MRPATRGATASGPVTDSAPCAKQDGVERRIDEAHGVEPTSMDPGTPGPATSTVPDTPIRPPVETAPLPSKLTRRR
jgi:hypothetical protein